MKLIDMLTKLIYKGKVPDNLSTREQEAFFDAAKVLGSFADELRELKGEIDGFAQSISKNRQIIDEQYRINRDPKSSGKERQDAAMEAVRLIKLNEALKLEAHKVEIEHTRKEKKLDTQVNRMGKKHHLTVDQTEELRNNLKDSGTAFTETASIVSISMGKMKDATRNGFSTILTDVGLMLKEFGLFGEVIGMALNRMEEMNKVLVDFNRQMSLGLLNNSLGSDLYGTTNTGNLQTIAGANNVDFSEFLKVFKGMDKGNVAGTTQDLTGQKDNMIKFGIQASQLSKFYGVEMGTINSITSNLVYNFGAKIEDLNTIFKDGKEMAVAAGVSVSGFFKNLEAASNLVGREYIAGGTAGLEKLALYASRTNQSIDTILATTDKFKNFQTQYELQNNAAAQGLTKTAEAMQRAWAFSYLGQKDKSDALVKGSAAKDLLASNGVTDGRINQQGQRQLENFGMKEDEIKSVQKLITMQDKAGVSIDDWLNRENATQATRDKIATYERENMKVGEKLKVMWDKISGAIIDPLTSVLSPLLDGLLDFAGVLTDLIVPLLKGLMWPISMLGRGLKKIYEWVEPVLTKLDNFFNEIGADFKAFGIGIDKIDNVFGTLIKTVGALIGALMLWKAGTGAVNIATSIGSSLKGLFTGGGMLGGIASRAGGVIGGIRGTIAGGMNSGMGGGMLTRLLGKTLASPGAMLKGGLIAGGIGLAGQFVGDAMGGKSGNKLKTISSDAAMGAMIGSIFPGIGTAVGAGIGAIVGLVHSNWDELGSIWTDNSKNLFEKLWDSVKTIVSSIVEIGKALPSAWNNLVNHNRDKDWEWYKKLDSWINKITGGDANDEIEEAKNNAAAIANYNPGAAGVTNAVNDVQKILAQRTNYGQTEMERKMEAEKKQAFSPTIHIQSTTTFDGRTKTRVKPSPF